MLRRRELLNGARRIRCGQLRRRPQRVIHSRRQSHLSDPIRAAESDQAAIGRPAGELVTVRQLQLAQNTADVGFDGLDRNEKLLGDFLVRVAARDQAEHLAFSLRQSVEILIDGRQIDAAGEGIEHEACQAW